MAVELGTAYVSISASAKGIGKSISSELEGPLAAGGTKAGEKAGTNAARGFGSKLKGGLSSLPINANLLGGAALAAGVKSTIDAASNLQESISKTDAVFRSNAGEVKAWAETASTSFGQSKQQALEAASTFGNLFQAFGVGLQPATEMSTTLTQLASDLASFNNTSVQEAVEALRSGLSGETEPLKRYGVALTDARLKQEALGLGLISDVKQPLDAAAKSQAAYALIMKDTALAQGDFARTSDGYANSMRTLQARVAELQAEIGTALLPAVTQVTQAFTGFIDVLDKVTGPLGGIGGAIAKFVDLAPGIQFFKIFEEGASGVDRMGAAVGTFIPVLGSFIASLDGVKATAAEIAGTVLIGPETIAGLQAGTVQLGFLDSATRGMTAAALAHAASERGTATALQAKNTALQESINLQLAAVSSTFAVTAASNAFTTANEAAAVATDDLKTGVNEQQVAYDSATQAAIATAAATVQYAKDQAAAEGATLSAKQEQRLLIDTLGQLAAKASGPVASAIGTVITKLTEVGQQKPNPTLNANDQASPKIAAVKLNLADLNGRTASVSINALTGGAENAIQRVHDAFNRLPRNFNFGANAAGVRNWRGGWSLVGEEGPELVNLPKGSDVYSNRESAAMIGGLGSTLAPGQAVVITGNTFIGSGPEVTKLLDARIREGRRAGVQFLGA